MCYCFKMAIQTVNGPDKIWVILSFLRKGGGKNNTLNECSVNKPPSYLT